MAVLLSLLAAAAYGLADFVGGVTSKKASPWSVALVAQLGGSTLVFLLSLVTDGDMTSADVWWSVVAGVANGFGTAFLYRGLSSRRMGVVAPVSGVGAVLVPVVVGLATGERPSPIVWIGIVAAIPGITFTRNSQCQEKAWVSQPPSVGPMVGASVAVRPMMTMAEARLAPGNSRKLAANTVGIMAPPMKPLPL